jgi:hypothetical protein
MGLFRDSQDTSGLSGPETMYRLNHSLIGAGHHFESFTIVTRTWVTTMEYLCHKWPRIYTLVVNISRSFPHSWLINGFVSILIRRAPLVSGAGTAYSSRAPEFTPVFSGVGVTRSLVLCVCLVDRGLSFCTCSLSHCVVCSSSMYASDYPFGILHI